MNHHFHALVWIDHHEAKIFYFDSIDSHRTDVASSDPTAHLHHKANSGDSGHVPLDKEFLKRVSQELAPAGAILITGPASAKNELATFIERTQPGLAKRISAVETLDHPSDGNLLAFARTFFKADDRMRSQSHK